jgi:predicted nucleic acid-binding Zn ribbon protein
MAEQNPQEIERRRRQRSRNLALLAVLLGVFVLFYVMTIVQFGGGSKG